MYKKKSNELRELIEFIHGTSEVNKVVPESRDLDKLAAVLASPEALKYLRTTRNLEDAYALTGGEEKSLINSLTAAGVRLDEALRYVHRYKNDVEVARLVERCTESLIEILNHFPKIRRRFSEVS